jgi:hypothetical protein
VSVPGPVISPSSLRGQLGRPRSRVRVHPVRLAYCRVDKFLGALRHYSSLSKPRLMCCTQSENVS